MAKIIVTGAGGFIGGHLVNRLLEDGHEVRAVDIKSFRDWNQKFDCQRIKADLTDLGSCKNVVSGSQYVYNLAADMGGMGFIETHKLDCMLNVLVSTNMLRAAADANVTRFFFSSSACVYPLGLQTNANVVALKEEDAYPADCEDGYGWEKLFSERMCLHYAQEHPIQTRIARYHNVYGSHGCWDGPRAKAPLAICRKVAEAVVSGRHEIEVWGDGEQTRSFMHVDDCVEGSIRLMYAEHGDPLNIGSAELVTINQLVSVVEMLAGVRLERHYALEAPKGVRGRNSDNTKIREVLEWEPSITLLEGLGKTYEWVLDQLQRKVIQPSAMTY